MNNIIKFRAWHKEKRFLIKNILSINFKSNTLGYGYDEKDSIYICNLPLDKVNLLQYTNQKDINGNDIYDGDILVDKFGRKRKVVWHGTYASFVFEIPNSKDFDFMNLAYLRYEIIGNIYETPELWYEKGSDK